MTDQVLLLETQGHVAIVTLNRPTSLNALDPHLVVALSECWARLAADPKIRAIVLTGAGQRAFCAGADLKSFVPLGAGVRAPENEWDRRVLAEPDILDVALLRKFDVGKPIVAAIQANAVGGGVELIQATDLRVMARDATLALKEVQWGLFPAGGSTVLLPRQLPWAVAMEMLLTGCTMTAAEALAHGLVNRVVQADEVLTTAVAFADHIASLAPLAVSAIRRSARVARSRTIEEGMAMEARVARPIFDTRDAAEGLAAFAEGRAPRYVGA